MNDPTKEQETICPKCKFTSGYDWSQCGGSCPMPGSPYYKQNSTEPGDEAIAKDVTSSDSVASAPRGRSPVTGAPLTSNLVSIVIQKPGQVPERKGPYPYDQVEPTLRELYKLYPGIVCIVMPGLPADCYPQHGHEYLDMLDAERCKCKLDKPRNPKCPVDHSRRADETAAEHRPGTEPLSRLAGDIDYCLAQITPGHVVYKTLQRVAKQLRGAVEPTGKTIHFREDSRSGELLVADSPLKASTPLCGNPVMINSEWYRGCQLPSGHEGDCKNLTAEAAQTYGSKAPAECNEGLGQSRERASNAGPGSSASTSLEAEAARAYGEAMFEAGKLQQKESGK